MTTQIPAAAREAAHAAAAAKLNSIYSGQIPESVARDIADAALDAARSHLHPELEAVEYCGRCHRSHLDCYC